MLQVLADLHGGASSGQEASSAQQEARRDGAGQEASSAQQEARRDGAGLAAAAAGAAAAEQAPAGPSSAGEDEFAAMVMDMQVCADSARVCPGMRLSSVCCDLSSCVSQASEWAAQMPGRTALACPNQPPCPLVA